MLRGHWTLGTRPIPKYLVARLELDGEVPRLALAIQIRCGYECASSPILECRRVADRGAMA